MKKLHEKSEQRKAERDKADAVPPEQHIWRNPNSHLTRHGGCMLEHKFRLGQKVQFNRGYPHRLAPEGFYEVVRQLPDLDGEFQYRIKSTREAHERVAKESDLRRT